MTEKQTNKDRMREIVDSIENGIKELFESDKYRQYLSTMSRFHRWCRLRLIGGFMGRLRLWSRSLFFLCWKIDFCF